MQEIIFKSPDYQTLLTEAENLGFINEDADGNKTIIVNGTFASGGSWFLNIVGDVYEPIDGPIDMENPPTPIKRDGYWGRLRINGEPETMPTFSDKIVQYVYVPGPDFETPGGWVNLADNTPAPDWVINIGVIA